MARENHRRGRRRNRKTTDNGMKLQALFRGLQSTRRRLGKPLQFLTRRLMKYTTGGRGSPFGREPETSDCSRALLQDLNLHSCSSSMDTRSRHHTACSPDRPQKSVPSMKRQRRLYHAGPNHAQGHRRPSGADADENWSSKLATPSKKSKCYRRRRKRQNQVGQRPPLHTVSTNQSIEAGSLVIDVGSQYTSPSTTSQPSPSVKPLPSVSNCESEASAREQRDWSWLQGMVHDTDRKIALVCMKCQSQLVDIQNQQPEVCITNYATFESWNSRCGEILVLQKDNEALKQSYQKKSAGYDRLVYACQDRKEQLKHAHEHSVDLSLDTEPISRVIRQRDQILSQANTIELLRSKVEELEKHKQRSYAVSGSYAEGSSTPALLNIAFFEAKAEVARLQKCFSHEAIRSKNYPVSVASLLNPDASIAKSHLVEYAFKAVVNQVLFEGFENESFNTICGAAKFLDPDLRRAKFYEYYQHEKEQHCANVTEDDPQYKDFFKTKHSALFEKLNLRSCESDKLGGPRLASSFKAAARSVWLLHKLAFSFEPPANIFRVERGADVDRNYMQAVEDLEDCKTLVPKVGFMVAPGLRLRKTILCCQIISHEYLESSTAY